jgi:hypothetical protein
MSLQFLDLYVCTVCYALGFSDITTAIQFTYNLQVFVDGSWSLEIDCQKSLEVSVTYVIEIIPTCTHFFFTTVLFVSVNDNRCM